MKEFPKMIFKGSHSAWKVVKNADEQTNAEKEGYAEKPQAESKPKADEPIQAEERKPLEEMTKDELLSYAMDLGHDLPNRDRNAVLIEKIRAIEEG